MYDPNVYIIHHIVTNEMLSVASRVQVAFYSQVAAECFLALFVGNTSYIGGGPISDYTFGNLTRDKLGNIIEDEFLIISTPTESLSVVIMISVSSGIEEG